VSAPRSPGAAPERPPWRIRRLPGAPLVAIRVAFAGGARVEPVPGAALVTGRGLAEGSRRRDYRELAEAAEGRGLSAAAFGAFEWIGVAVDGLASAWEEALELAAELALEPSFPEARVRLLARQAAAELEAQSDDGAVVTGRAFARLLYGEHPKGRPIQGDAASLARIDRELCLRLHAEALAAGGVVTVAGAIDERRVEACVGRLFGGLAPPRPPGFPTAPPAASARRVEVATRGRDQGHLYVGQLSVARTHPDCAALEIAAVALGAGPGLSGRIPNRVRDREGLAYDASADAVAGAGLDAGRLVAYAGTSPATLARAERAIVEELEQVRAAGLAVEEIEEARAYLAGREPFRRETARQWADLAAAGAIEGLPFEDEAWSRRRILEPGAAEVAAALGRHLDPARLAVAVGRPGR
jgi:zinc protease